MSTWRPFNTRLLEGRVVLVHLASMPWGVLEGAPGLLACSFGSAWPGEREKESHLIRSPQKSKILVSNLFEIKFLTAVYRTYNTANSSTYCCSLVSKYFEIKLNGGLFSYALFFDVNSYVRIVQQ